MISAGEQELVCDLAETYHIFDFRSLPVKLVATLSSGLREEESRIKRKLNKEKYPHQEVLLAMLVDRVAMIQHALFGIKEPPKLVTEAMLGIERPKKGSKTIKPEVYDSPEAFHAAYNKKIGGINGD